LPKALLDDKFAKHVERPTKGRVDYTDEKIGGFEARVSADRIVCCYRYRPLGSPDRKRYDCGEYPAVTMAEARKRAETARGIVRAGGDPNAEREAVREARKKEAATPKLDFNGLVAVYLPELAKQKSSWEQDKGYLFRDAQSVWGTLAPEKISKQDCAKRLLDVAQRAPVSANRLRSALMRIFDWAVDQGLLQASPMVGIKKPTRERKEEVDRTLSDAELIVLWKAIETAKIAPGLRAALQVLALSGQRPNEIAGLELRELHHLDNAEQRYADIPASRMKGRRRHVWPISEPIAKIIIDQIERQKREAEAEGRPMNPHIFASRFADKTRVARHSLSQALRRIIPALEEDGEDGDIVKQLKADPPTPHCFRRTFVTGLSRLRIPKEDRKACVAHADDDVMARHYDAHDKFEEKKIAFDAWARHVEALISGQKSTGAVLLFRPSARA
jgi:integrase